MKTVRVDDREGRRKQPGGEKNKVKMKENPGNKDGSKGKKRYTQKREEWLKQKMEDRKLMEGGKNRMRMENERTEQRD